jgi:hypothetical protein
MFMEAAVLGLRRAGWGSGAEVVVTGLQAMAAKIATAATGIGAKRMVPPGEMGQRGPNAQSSCRRPQPVDYLPRGEPPPPHGAPMTKRDDQRIAALAKKNAAKVKPPRQDQAADFDPTLRQRAPEQDAETKRLFKEMKRREF